jgi:excisionase family DNA binding protein
METTMKSKSRFVTPLGVRISVSIEDAAILTGLSRSRIYELIDANEIRSIHIGRRHLVLVSSLLELLGETSAAGDETLG